MAAFVLTAAIAVVAQLSEVEPPKPPPTTCSRGVYPWELVSYRLGWHGDEWDCHYVKHGVR